MKYFKEADTWFTNQRLEMNPNKTQLLKIFKVKTFKANEDCYYYHYYYYYYYTR